MLSLLSLMAPLAQAPQAGQPPRVFAKAPFLVDPFAGLHRSLHHFDGLQLLSGAAMETLEPWPIDLNHWGP